MNKRITAVMIVLMMLLSTAVSFGLEQDNAVVIANPVDGSTVYSDNLLVSVKITQTKKIRVSVFEQKKKVGSETVSITIDDLEKADQARKSGVKVNAFVPVAFGEPEEFTSKGNLTFYTQKMEKVTPGVYKVKVETLGSNGKATHVSEANVYVKSKDSKNAEEDAKIFNSEKTGASQFLQNLLKNIFGN